MTWTEWKGGECPVEPETVADRLRAVIGSRSVRSISVKAGLSPDALRMILNGRSKAPKGETLWSLAQALGVDVNWLLTGRGHATPKPATHAEAEACLACDDPPEKPFSTRITEAEEKALEAIEAFDDLLSGFIRSLGPDADHRVTLVLGNAREDAERGAAAIQTAAALARDYSLKVTK